MVVVVGAGPAGMMAAIRAGELKKRVFLIEKNDAVGRKLLLTGNGRCNLTNAATEDAFRSRFFSNGEFLRDAFKKFFNKELMSFFEEAGLKLKVERQLRVFPITDSSLSVVRVLEKKLRQNNVNLILRKKVKSILISDGQARGVVFNDATTLEADAVVLATGGLSYPSTGSTGDGLKMASQLGHSIVSCRPGLVALKTKKEEVASLEGLTLKNIRIHFFNDQKRNFVTEIGELLFTSFGISGPLVFSASSKVVDWLWQGREVFASIDLKPALTFEQLDARLRRDLLIYSRKDIKNYLKTLLPQRLIKYFLQRTGIPEPVKVSQINRKQRIKLVSLCKSYDLKIIDSLPLEEAMVTRGGISLKEVNPKTMESRLIKGLYFAGEILDIDADTGGFNLQAAFSTGYLAGESAALN